MDFTDDSSLSSGSPEPAGYSSSADISDEFLDFNPMIQKRIQDAISVIHEEGGKGGNLMRINETLNILGQVFKSESVVVNVLQGTYGLSLCSAFKKLLSTQTNKHINKMVVLVLGRILTTYKIIDEGSLNGYEQKVSSKRFRFDDDENDPFSFKKRMEFVSISTLNDQNVFQPCSQSLLANNSQSCQYQYQYPSSSFNFSQNVSAVHQQQQQLSQNISTSTSSQLFSCNDMSQQQKDGIWNGVPVCFIKSDIVKYLCSLMASSDVDFFNIIVKFISLLITVSKIPPEKFLSAIEAILRNASIFINEKNFDKAFWIQFHIKYLSPLAQASPRIQHQVVTLYKVLSAEWINSEVEALRTYQSDRDQDIRGRLDAFSTLLRINIDFEMPLANTFKERRFFDGFIQLMRKYHSKLKFGSVGLEFTLKILLECKTANEFETLFKDNAQFIHFLEKRLIVKLDKNETESVTAFKIIELLYDRILQWNLQLNIKLRWSIASLFPDIQFLFRTNPASMRFLNALIRNNFHSTFIEVLEYHVLPKTLNETLQNIQFHIGSLFYRVGTMDYESILWDTLECILSFSQREVKRQGSPLLGQIKFPRDFLLNPWLAKYTSMALSSCEKLSELNNSILRFLSTWSELIIKEITEAKQPQERNMYFNSKYPCSYFVLFASMNRKITVEPSAASEEDSRLKTTEIQRFAEIGLDDRMDVDSDVNSDQIIINEKRVLLKNITENVGQYYNFKAKMFGKGQTLFFGSFSFTKNTTGGMYTPLLSYEYPNKDRNKDKTQEQTSANSSKTTEASSTSSGDPQTSFKTPPNSTKAPRKSSKPQNSFKTPRNSTKRPLNSSKTPQTSVKTPRNSTKALQKSSRTPQTSGKTPINSSIIPQTLSKTQRTSTKASQNAFKPPKTTSKMPLNSSTSSKTPQTTVKTPRSSTKAPRNLSKTPQTSGKTPVNSSIIPQTLSKTQRTSTKASQNAFKPPKTTSKMPLNSSTSSKTPLTSLAPNSNTNGSSMAPPIPLKRKYNRGGVSNLKNLESDQNSSQVQYTFGPPAPEPEPVIIPEPIQKVQQPKIAPQSQPPLPPPPTNENTRKEKPKVICDICGASVCKGYLQRHRNTVHKSIINSIVQSIDQTIQNQASTYAASQSQSQSTQPSQSQQVIQQEISPENPSNTQQIFQDFINGFI